MLKFFGYLMKLIKLHPWFFGIVVILGACSAYAIVLSKRVPSGPAIWICLVSFILKVILALLCIWLIEIVPVRILNRVVALVAWFYLTRLVDDIEYKLIDIAVDR